MPVDANGTPSAKLGIYKYNTAGDAPSGKGLNNIVDSLDDIISRLGISGMVANDVPVYDSVAGKWKKASGSHTGTNFLRDDGTWAPVSGGFGGNVTVSAWSGGPPGSPGDKDVWVAKDVDANGVRWVFQYNSGSASTYKWEFIGGSDAYTQINSGTTVAQATALDTVVMTNPRAGDYECEITVTKQASDNTQFQFGYGPSSALTVAQQTQLMYVASFDGRAYRFWQPAVPASQKLFLRLFAGGSAGQFMAYSDIPIFVRPRRII